MDVKAYPCMFLGYRCIMYIFKTVCFGGPCCCPHQCFSSDSGLLSNNALHWRFLDAGQFFPSGYILQAHLAFANEFRPNICTRCLLWHCHDLRCWHTLGMVCRRASVLLTRPACCLTSGAVTCRDMHCFPLLHLFADVAGDHHWRCTLASTSRA